MAPISVTTPADVPEHLPDQQKTTSVTQVTAAPDVDINDDSTIKTVDELVRRRAMAHPDRVIVSYPSSGIDYVDYTMKQIDVYAFRVAKYYEQFIPSRKSSDEKPTTVALLGPSNFDYLITMLALNKLGHTILFLSTRISQEAVDNLVRLTEATYFLVDPRYVETAEATRQSIEMKGVVDIAPRSTYDFPIEYFGDTRMDQALDSTVETNNNIFIIHSSGSTGLPKPIFQTQKSAVANYAFSPKLRAFITLPLYHNHGICNMFRAIYCGKPLHLYNADLPLTHDYLTKIMRAHQFEIFYGVPYALKLLSESEEGMEVLRNLKTVMYGGSACPDDLGNYLVDNGVNLIAHYGATEVGQLLTSIRPPGDKEWNYLRERPELIPYLRWIPRGGNLFESCVLPGWPSKVASNMEDGSYATKDLFEPHPTIPRAWKYIARRDDTIKLINGEMFNPVTTEGAIRTNKNIAEAVIFGAGRDYPGALIIPATSTADMSKEEILEIAWPLVEASNKSVEAYARISKEMIRILPYDCNYPRTDKGSIIRQAFYKQFSQDIEEAYDQADVASQELQKLSQPEIKDFIRASVVKMLGKEFKLDDATDFFLLGVDSLQSIQLRSEILRTLDIGGAKLGQTVVFDYPSVEKLSSYLFGLSSGEGSQSVRKVEEEMQELINKYSASPATPRSSVVVTGATGSLGAHIVSKLVADPTITTIYCLARASSDEDATRRVRNSLVERRVYHTMPLSHRSKIVALAADFAHPKLGLSTEAYDSVRKNLRTVIHSAWAVNFNMHLSSFEPGNIAGLSHLINLCQSSTDTETNTPAATFNFCSSVSTVVRADVSPVPERVPDLNWAQGMGYAQSKCVAEHLCSRAGEKGVKARVLRIGQITADTNHGIWNATEAIPLMLQSAITVGALPKLKENPSWLPVDTVAQAVSDISLSEAAGGVIANVTNPQYFDWTNDLLPALKKAGLEFEAVEPQEWVKRLRESNPDPQANPPIKLVDFFASKYDKTEFAPSKVYDTDVARKFSPALAAAPVLDQEHVGKFVSNFKVGAWAPRSASSDPVQKTAVVVSGSDSVTKSLATQLNVPVVDADSLLSKSEAEKRASSAALNEAEASSWLQRVSDRVAYTLSELGYDSVVVKSSNVGAEERATLRKKISSAKPCFIDVQTEGESDKSSGLDEIDVLPVNGAAGEVEKETKWVLGQLGIKL